MHLMHVGVGDNKWHQLRPCTDLDYSVGIRTLVVWTLERFRMACSQFVPTNCVGFGHVSSTLQGELL